MPLDLDENEYKLNKVINKIVRMIEAAGGEVLHVTDDSYGRPTWNTCTLKYPESGLIIRICMYYDCVCGSGDECDCESKVHLYVWGEHCYHEPDPIPTDELMNYDYSDFVNYVIEHM